MGQPFVICSEQSSHKQTCPQGSRMISRGCMRQTMQRWSSRRSVSRTRCLRSFLEAANSRRISFANRCSSRLFQYLLTTTPPITTPIAPNIRQSHLQKYSFQRLTKLFLFVVISFCSFVIVYLYVFLRSSKVLTKELIDMVVK